MAITDGPPIREVASRLARARSERITIGPVTDEHPGMTVDDAYAVADALVGLELAAGARLIGAKLGLTSRAKQVEMGIDAPIRGWLTDRMLHEAGDPLEVGLLGQPRAEPEVALTMGRDLAGPDVSEADVRLAIATVHAAIEVLDSRFAGYRFRLPDVIADNASAGRFVLGPPVPATHVPDLALVGCVLERGGAVLATAAGAAALGHPAAAVAWLVRALALSGRGLRAGDVVLTGGLTAVTWLEPGVVVRATFDRIGSVEVRCV
jgi:2-keto-4-pentenoate hydratase